MKKKLICFATSMIIAMGTCVPAMAAGVTATPNKASVSVDGTPIAIGAYNINGYNYFKLRDVAAALNGTDATFSIEHNSDFIFLNKKVAYTATGKELKDTAPTAAKTATESHQFIVVGTKEVDLHPYLIDGYNYFQLRELAQYLDFDIAWDNTAKAINIVTKTTPSTTDEDETADVQNLQKQIDDAKANETIYLNEEYAGTPGDKIFINKPLTICADTVTRLKNITFVINTDEKVSLFGLIFEGSKSTENALLIQKAGSGSSIEYCIFQNYLSDAIIINEIANGGTFNIANNEFMEFGLDKKKVDGAITLDAQKAMDVTYNLVENQFYLKEEVADENTMDAALTTTVATDGTGFYNNTFVKFINNVITKGENSYTVDMYSDIPNTNVTQE